MAERVAYELGDDGVALVAMDDGKVNAMSRAMVGEVAAAFDRAAADGAAVLLTGRAGVFSGGFDLATLRGGDAAEITAMVRGGFELAATALAHPRPVVVASGGHAIAMGVFLLLCGDLRIGVRTGGRYSANEVAIGLSVPATALAILRYRLTPAAVDRAALTAAAFGPEEALSAGFLTELVDDPDALLGTARQRAAEAVRGLDANGFRETKLRARAGLLAELRAALSEIGPAVGAARG
jgi:enoyl-CoA hydratase